ncbi:hypothetical protein [Nostoc phage Nsp-JY21]
MVNLFDVAARHMAGPFEWGVRDCAISACAAFAEVTGVDVLAQFRGRWCGPVSAARLIRRAGGLAAMARAAGLVPGQGGLAEYDGAIVFGVGPGVWAGKGRFGMVLIRKELGGWVCHKSA